MLTGAEEAHVSAAGDDTSYAGETGYERAEEISAFEVGLDEGDTLLFDDAPEEEAGAECPEAEATTEREDGDVVEEGMDFGVKIASKGDDGDAEAMKLELTGELKERAFASSEFGQLIDEEKDGAIFVQSVAYRDRRRCDGMWVEFSEG